MPPPPKPKAGIKGNCRRQLFCLNFDIIYVSSDNDKNIEFWMPKDKFSWTNLHSNSHGYWGDL